MYVSLITQIPENLGVYVLVKFELKSCRPFSVPKDVCAGRVLKCFIYIMALNLSLKPVCLFAILFLLRVVNLDYIKRCF